MDIKSRVERLKQNLDLVKAKHRLFLLKWISIVILIALLTELILFLTDTSDFSAFLVVLFIGLMVMFIPTILLSVKKGQQLKRLYIKEVIEIYNENNDSNLEFSGNEKVSREFNQEMGLFTKYASVQATYLINGSLSDHHKYRLLNCQLVTSNGKSSTVHFNGLYFMFEFPTDDFFQIRSRFKPRLSGTKFKQIERYSEKVFISEMDIKEYVEEKYLQYYRTINRLVPNKAIYLASNQKEIHLAITPRERFKNIKDLNVETFEQYYLNYVNILNTVIKEFENTIML